MAVILFLFVVMATTPAPTTTTPSSTSAASTSQPSSPSAIEAATRAHNRIFAAYVIVLVLTVVGTVWVWISGNRVSDAIQAEAGARISEANLKIAQLTNENLKLQSILLPRRVPIRPKESDSVRVARHREVVKYSQTYALIQPVPDFEAQTLALDISSALINSGWATDIVGEDRTHIPPRLIKSGVRIVTLESWRFKSGSQTVPPSKSGQAANALAGLLSLDLAPPAGPESLGVRWEPEYKGHLTPIMKGISKLPDGAVLILVGMKPVDGILGGLQAAPTVRNK
jgi:hypothetical protein